MTIEGFGMAVNPDLLSLGKDLLDIMKICVLLSQESEADFQFGS